MLAQIPEGYAELLEFTDTFHGNRDNLLLLHFLVDICCLLVGVREELGCDGAWADQLWDMNLTSEENL